MTQYQKHLWEICSPVYQRLGHPPVPRNEDQLWEQWLRCDLLDRLYLRGHSLTELWRCSIPELVAALERV
jgi:hypothetical protein